MNRNEGIVIVGAGIIGLNVALVLSERGYGRSITILAEHLPGDTSIAYTSPWAGCNFSAISGSSPNELKWDRLGYAHLTKLASEKPDESFVKRTPSTELWDEEIPYDKIEAMGEYLEDFRILPDSELPEGVKYAVSFTTVTINAPKHVEYLYHRLKDQYGVRDGATYSYETESILDRTTRLSSELRKDKPEILAVFAGLRPSREGGARVERDQVSVAGKKRTVVHNYGAGGTGFQAGYGMAWEAVRTVEDILRELRGQNPQPHL
ncbi:putative d-amino acid protein [Phaeoacremonium minimum UCRPA7]|uniref:Putative d-amino acid protein n=1 Tax=Phaeoacremonium minimum (strain UCR-PA7) TaxID=1286976 RepID=R8BDK8_PHAM7|nr:putative d-amino acid protein [Phaeoacremonium minimum UCRPA7]EON97384.1 putative d-amino acid protein [Phaeoacremonium minimum UCRPA7]